MATDPKTRQTGLRVAAAFVAVAVASRATPGGQLASGTALLSVEPNGPLTVTLDGRPAVTVADPLTTVIVDRTGAIRTAVARYATVGLDGDRLVCLGTAAGVTIRDAYAAGPTAGTFTVGRSATAAEVAPTDAGYRTEVSLPLTAPAALPDVEPFVPGMWYADDRHVPPAGMLRDFPGRRDWLFREDRLPLPVVAVRRKSSGLTVALSHLDPDGGTFAGEDVDATVTDARLHFASLGLRREGDHLAVALGYPGVEGDQTRLPGRRHPGVRRAERFHPLVVGATQTYRWQLRVSSAANFDVALGDPWRSAYAAARPPVVAADPAATAAASVDVLAHYFGRWHDVPGFPFAVAMPGGHVRDVSLQMGFVGEQLPCAAHLIAEGFDHGRPDRIQMGSAVADFWAAHTLSPAGVPRVWYDVDPQPHWRAYPTYTRIATDGMEGLLQAWRVMRTHGRDRPAWLACCRTYGDWLVAHQNADGSFYRSYHWDGTPDVRSPSATTHPVRFLVDLTFATGDGRYRAAAVRAGTFAVGDIGATANYYGGTADNADVTDKEAGWIAFDSFLSLYDATADRRWLAAAERAAAFTETWAYCWSVPIPAGQTDVALPPVKTTAGLSLIATGHSGCDLFLAFAPAAYLRLSVATGDAHWADVARLLQHDTAQFVDVGGSLGYAVPGLVTEAATLADARGRGVNVWLPWCTAAYLDSFGQLRQAFGTVSVDDVLNLPADRRAAMAAAYARRHGFPAP